MVFSSPAFLFLFLPLFLFTYYLLPGRFRLHWILWGSWIFYGLWRPDFLILLIAVSFFNWAAGMLIEGRRGTSRGKVLVSLAVTINLLVLAYFKYANFGLESLNTLFAFFGIEPLGFVRIILPVGISFYIFQALSYTVDVYRGDAPAAGSFVELGSYIALFPQLIAGPIVRYKDLSDQLREPHISPGRAYRGLHRFMRGFVRKILFADSLGSLVDAVFNLDVVSPGDAWLGVVAYGVQLYMDFAAYSDMAIGLGLMLGFRFRENFRQPYHARSITEFWQRWHISLSSWLRDYLYIPLGGNRQSPRRTLVNLFLVMLLGGLWHGASWNFVLWGAWHGILLIAERLISARRSRLTESPAGRLAARMKTIFLVLIGWIFFRAETLTQGFSLLRAMVPGLVRGLLSGDAGISPGLAWQIDPVSMLLLASGIVLIIVEGPLWAAAARSMRSILLNGRLNNPLIRKASGLMPGSFSSGIILWLPFLLAIFKLLADSYSPFLYFQF